MAQLNVTVGDIKGNLKKHIHAAITAREELQADLIIFPELSLIGYPPEDLLLRQNFLDAADHALQTFINEITDIYCVISHSHSTPNGIYNSSSVIYNRKVLGHYAKQHLPNYGVFDEDRYFIPGHKHCVIPIKNTLVGFVICEDAWFQEPIKEAVKHGAEIIIVPNASPFETNKHEQRIEILSNRARENSVPIIYVNHAGGQDELVFDGGSMVINHQGELAAFAGFFNETLLPIESNHLLTIAPPLPSSIERIYNALVVGVRDYVIKNGFQKVCLGVSGGIDSALTLAIAVDAIGKENVRAVIMPSRHTSDISMEDALAVTQHADVQSDIISIEPMYKTMLATLCNLFIGKKTDITEENIQARCRAMILMALSNKFGYLVLITSNRSELAVGYGTLYGDMAGGFAVLKDIPKMIVYELARYRNTLNYLIPDRTITRPPTAELAPHQTDEATLAPYPILDKILYYYLNEGKSAHEIIAEGFEELLVNKILNLVRLNEYKRKQTPLGPHINHKSFGKDWRYPVTNQFKE